MTNGSLAVRLQISQVETERTMHQKMNFKDFFQIQWIQWRNDRSQKITEKHEKHMFSWEKGYMDRCDEGMLQTFNSSVPWFIMRFPKSEKSYH